MTYNEFRKEALNSPEVQAKFEALMPKYALIKAILDAQIEKE